MHFIATFVDWTRKVWRCRKTESKIKSLARSHILSPKFRENHQNSWRRISEDRFLPSWKFQELYIVWGKTFLSGILNSGHCLQFEGYIEGNYLFWVFQWQWSSLPVDDGLRNHVWGLVIGGDRLTSGNQGIQIRQIWPVSRCSVGRTSSLLPTLPLETGQICRRPGTQDRKRWLLGILGLGDIRTLSLQH